MAEYQGEGLWPDKWQAPSAGPSQRALLERSWDSAHWISDPGDAPGSRGNRLGWQMPAPALSTDLAPKIAPPPRRRAARPQSAMGRSAWTRSEQRRREEAAASAAAGALRVAALQRQIDDAQAKARESFGDADWGGSFVA